MFDSNTLSFALVVWLVGGGWIIVSACVCWLYAFRWYAVGVQDWLLYKVFPKFNANPEWQSEALELTTIVTPNISDYIKQVGTMLIIIMAPLGVVTASLGLILFAHEQPHPSLLSWNVVAVFVALFMSYILVTRYYNLKATVDSYKTLLTAEEIHRTEGGDVSVH